MDGFITIIAALDRYPMSRRSLYLWMRNGSVQFRIRYGSRQVLETEVAQMCAAMAKRKVA